MKNREKKIIPAVLTNNFQTLKNKLTEIKKISRWVQIDIMDGKFVSQKSIPLQFLKKINLRFFYEIHFMVYEPQKYLSICKDIKAKRIIFHFEGTKSPEDSIALYKKSGFEVGLAINPKTSIFKIKKLLSKIDLFLILGVFPGKQGQKFIPSTLQKIRILKKMNKKIILEVDGGIKLSNISSIAKAGADYFVIGSALVESKNIKRTFSHFKRKIGIKK